MVYLQELQVHAARLQLRKLPREANQVARHATLLQFALVLGGHVRQYFEG